jgi:hypothetical protein
MTSPQRYAIGRIRTRRSDGDWDYFPSGWLGRGYRVDAAELARFVRLERVATLAAVLIWPCAAVLLAVVVRGSIDPRTAIWSGGLVALVIATAWFRVAVARRGQRLQPAEGPLTWIELRRWEASVLSGWRLLLLFVVAMGVMALGVLLVVRAAPDPDLDRVVLGTSLGFLCLVIGCYGFAKLTCTSWFRFSVGRRNSVG